MKRPLKELTKPIRVAVCPSYDKKPSRPFAPIDIGKTFEVLEALAYANIALTSGNKKVAIQAGNLMADLVEKYVIPKLPRKELKK